MTFTDIMSLIVNQSVHFRDCDCSCDYNTHSNI